MPTKSKSNQATEDLQAALEAVTLASGLTQGDIVGMVAEAIAIKHAEEVGCQVPMLNLHPTGKQKVYRELPPGCITVPDAVRKYGVKPHTIYHWLEKGCITNFGRLKGRAVGGGFIILMESEFVAYKDGPRKKPGRKTKIKQLGNVSV